MSIFSPLISSFGGSAGRTSSILGGIGTLSSPRQTPAAKIQQTLDQAKLDANRQQIMASAELRIRGIAQGTIQPRSEWEKVAGFLAITGQPFTYSVDNRGQVQVQPQSRDDLSFVPNSQRRQMSAALQRLDEVRQQVDTVNTKTALRTRLQIAVARLGDLERFAPPQEQWERDFQTIRSTGRPVMVGLGPEGDVRAINQLQSGFDYVEDPSKRAILQQAGRELENILNGSASATKGWQYQALGNKVSGDDYFLDVDQNNEIVVRRNQQKRGGSSVLPLFQQTGERDYHIIPEFLKPSREDTRIFKADWERQAAELFQAKRPFHLELVGDRVVVRETNFSSARRADLLDMQANAQRRAQSVLDILS
jgi:hypothetical protein